MAESWDSGTRATVQKLPLLATNAGPRDKELWPQRLKEASAEYDGAGNLRRRIALRRMSHLTIATPMRLMNAGTANIDQVHRDE